MKEKFVDINFRPASLKMIATLDKILADYQAQGYVLSLRQLYYQLVARAIIPNTERSYKQTGDLVSNARLAGLLDWDMIEDRGRDTIMPPRWDSPASIIRAAANQFAIDCWAGQDNHVEVMVEKAALEGVLRPVCLEEGVNFTSNRGYSSSSTMREIGKRLQRLRRANKIIHVLYMGDHDPSGIDMTRDVRERLEMFSRGPVEVHRLALNMDQVEQWQPPDNPAKLSDARADAYIAQFGESSWELDAVEPTTLGGLVRDQINDLRDAYLYAEQKTREDRMKSDLLTFAETYKENTDDE